MLLLVDFSRDPGLQGVQLRLDGSAHLVSFEFVRSEICVQLSELSLEVLVGFRVRSCLVLVNFELLVLGLQNCHPQEGLLELGLETLNFVLGSVLRCAAVGVWARILSHNFAQLN